MSKGMLAEAYDLDGSDETRDFYDKWADGYDAEVAENGYATPRRCAEALAAYAGDKEAAVLDIGCGTGLGGAALGAAGFTTIDGTDFSPEMLAQAKGKGVYRALFNTDLANPLPFDLGAYANIAAIGVLNPGHAPAETFDDVLALLPEGGHFVFSLNDHALADASYEARVSEYVDTGAVQLLFKEHGEHLPQIGLGSTVYVIRKA